MNKEDFVEFLKESISLQLTVTKGFEELSIALSIVDNETMEVIADCRDSVYIGENYSS